MKKICVVGYPAKHSLSPVIHNYWLKKYGIDGAYEIREIAPDKFAEFFKNMQYEGYTGCNVTVPFKENAYNSVKAFEPGDLGLVAKWSKAVNTVVIRDGIFTGSNTDWLGFYNNLIQSQPEFNFTHGKAVILGAGGAARGIVQALIFAKVPEIIILNRSLDKAQQIISEIKETDIRNKFTALPWDARSEALKDANLLINTTSLGMSGQPPLDISLENLPKTALVTDIVYRPLITPILQIATDRGNPIVDGLGMLLHQAAPGFQMWFADELNGQKVEVTKQLRDMVEGLL